MMHDQLGIAAVVNASTSAAGAIVFAASEQVQIVAIGAIVSVITGVATIYFAYKAKTISQEAKDISQEAKDATKETSVAVDGKMEKMLEIAKSLSHAEGVVQGVADAEGKAAIRDAAKAEGRAQINPAAPLAQPSPLLPSQVQPVTAEAVEGVKLTPEQIDKMIRELQEQKLK